MGINAALLEKLACPICKKDLSDQDENLVCEGCRKSYTVFKGIPNFMDDSLIEEYNANARGQSLQVEKSFYDNMYENLDGVDDGHCVVYGYEEIYDFMDDIEGGTLLDVGCGTGHHSKDLSARGYEVTGIDISLNGLIHAQKVEQASNQMNDFALGDIENLPFKDGSFDVVFCSLILHHFLDMSNLLSEINRVCKKYFVTFEVNSFDPISFVRFNILNPTIGIHNISKNQRTVNPTKLEKQLGTYGFTDFSTRFVDVHHYVGRRPESFRSKMILAYQKYGFFLPRKSRYNKFLMKCRKP